MHFNFYSFMMAMLTSTVMIIVIYFLKKIKYFTNTFGVWYMALLYLLSFCRLLLPFEFDKAQVLGDRFVLTKVMDVLENRSVITAGLPCSMLGIFGSASLIVTFILLLVFTIKQLKFVSFISRTENYATKEEQDMLEEISSVIFARKIKMKLIKSKDVPTPMVVGVLKRTVILPCIDYTKDQLELIFCHECTHLKNHDLWLKLLVHIYCCVYWFNPFVYLLKADMDFILEVKCDNAVSRKLSDEKRLDYAKLVNDTARNAVTGFKQVPLVASGFTSVSTSRHICRMNSVLNPEMKNPGVPTVIVSLMMVVICVLSYAFIWQPDYTTVKNGTSYSAHTETGYIDGYLVFAENRDYYFCYDESRVLVPKEDVDKGYYCNYAVVEKENITYN